MLKDSIELKLYCHLGDSENLVQLFAVNVWDNEFRRCNKLQYIAFPYKARIHANSIAAVGLGFGHHVKKKKKKNGRWSQHENIHSVMFVCGFLDFLNEYNFVRQCFFFFFLWSGCVIFFKNSPYTRQN